MALLHEDDQFVSEFGTGSDDTKHENGSSVAPKIKDFDPTFGTETWREDTTLIVQSKKLYIVSGVLSLVSPVFTEMFESVLENDRPREIELKEKRYDDMVEFLLCLYPNVHKNIDMDNVFVVLTLAVEYDTKLLQERCRNFLLTHIENGNMKVDDMCLCLSKACAFGMTDVKEKCIGILAECEYTAMQKAEEQFPLPLDAKVEIQNRVIKSQDRKIIRMRYAENILKRVDLKKLWFGDVQEKVNGFVNSCVGYLEYPLCFLKRGEFEESPVISVHGISWSIRFKFPNKGGFLEFFLKANVELPQNVTDWSCRVYAILQIRNHSNESIYECRNFEQTFKEKSSKGYKEFIAMEQLEKLSELIISNKIQLEIKFIAEEPSMNVDL